MVGPLQRFAGAVQDRTARIGLKARGDRRSSPRSAHHFAASLRAAPLLTRRHAVVERRHCQQAASNDARVLTGHRARARDHAHRHASLGGYPCRLPGVLAPSDGTARCRAAKRDQSPQVKPRGDKSQGADAPVHWGTTNARPLGITQSDSGSDELEGRVTTAPPVRSPMEQGKEPSQRSFKLTIQERGRQEVLNEMPAF